MTFIRGSIFCISILNLSAEFLECVCRIFSIPLYLGLVPPPSPIFSCKKFRFEPLILKQNIYPRPTHHTSPMYDTIREDNDHIVEIYISLCAKCSCRVEKCVCSKTCTREHSAPASAQNILPRILIIFKYRSSAGPDFNCQLEKIKTVSRHSN